ncbi:MAG: type II toxin-antitoxin system VapC family toxin [Sulfuricaulis sp.]
MLIDTSVWVDHFRRRNARLAELVEVAQVWTHPFVVGELACGILSRRREVLSLLEALPQAPLVDHREVLTFIEARRLPGRGLGWVDVHLLASARLVGLPFWTLDKSLFEAARELALTPVAF